MQIMDAGYGANVEQKIYRNIYLRYFLKQLGFLIDTIGSDIVLYSYMYVCYQLIFSRNFLLGVY